MRRISLPVTDETEQIMRLSRRLDLVVTRLHQQMDRLPLLTARPQIEEEVDRGTDPEPDEGSRGPDDRGWEAP